MKYLVPVACLLLVGCSDSATDTVVVETQPATTVTEVRQTTVFDTQLGALDKAKQVESTLLDAAEAERLKIEQESE